ncbi:MAG TPA: hypothetical protein VJS92_02430 [Candidatus Polarisedimenticolaceae bacterium]|nr:hypothetical protein [Candidatus Polarisedimenticolaceae bacterium]
MINGFEATLSVAAWMLAVALHGAYRSMLRPEPDPPRPSGPIE